VKRSERIRGTAVRAAAAAAAAAATTCSLTKGYTAHTHTHKIYIYIYIYIYNNIMLRRGSNTSSQLSEEHEEARHCYVKSRAERNANHSTSSL
jgi:hypothetical protein